MQVVNNNITWSHSALRPLEVTIQVSIFINDGLFDVTRARPMMLSSDWDVDLAACQAYNLVHNTSYLVGQSTAARGGVGVENPNGNGFNLYYEHGMRVTDLLTVPQNSCLVVADGPFVPFRMLVADEFGSFVTGLMLANNEDELALNSQSNLKERLMVQSLAAAEHQFHDFIKSSPYAKAHAEMAGHYNPPPHQPIATQLFNTSTLPPIGSQHSMTSTLPPIGSQHSMTSTLPPIGSQHSMTSTLPPIGSQNSFNGTLHLHDPLSSHSLAEREATHAHLATLFMQHQTKDKANGQRMSGSPHTHPTHHTPHTTQHTNGTTAPPTSAHAHTHTSPQGSAGTPQALANTHSHGTLDMSANGSVGHTVRTPEDSAIECSSGKTNSRSNSHSHRSSNATDYGHCPHTQQETGASTTSVNATAANATPGTQPTNGAAPQYTIAETQPSAAQGERSCTFEECQERTVAEIMGHGADVHPNDTDSTQLHLGRLSIDASGSAANNASDGAMGYDRGAGHVDSLTEGSLCMLKEAYKYPTIVDWVARRTLGGKPPNDSTGMAIDDTATNFPTLTSLDDMNDTEMEEAFNGLVNNITLPAINMTKYRAHPQPQSHPTDNMYTHHTHASLSHSHSANTLQSHTTQSSDGSGATNTHPNTHTNTELVSGLDSHVGASAYEHTPSGTVNGAYNWGAFNTYQGLANGEYEDILKETFGMTGEDAINVLADSLSERVELGDDAKGPAGPDLENGARGPDLAQDRLLHQDSAASTNNAGSDTHTPQDEANRITTTTTTAATTTTNTITTTNITTTTTTDITNGKSKGTATATDATAAEATAKKGGKRKPTAKEIKGASGRVDTGAITKAPRKMRVSDKNWRDKVANQLEDLKNAVPALDGEIKRTKAEIFNGATEFIRTTVNDNAKLKWQIQQQKRMMQEAECVHKQARLRADSYAANNGMLILEHDEHTLTLGPRLVYADHHWKLMTGHMRPEGKRVPELCGTDHNPFMYSACDVINRTIFEATEQWFGIMICRRRDGTIMGCHSSIEPLTLPNSIGKARQSVVLTSNWYILDLSSPIVGPGGEATLLPIRRQIEEAERKAHLAIQPRIK